MCGYPFLNDIYMYICLDTYGMYPSGLVCFQLAITFLHSISINNRHTSTLFFSIFKFVTLCNAQNACMYNLNKFNVPPSIICSHHFWIQSVVLLLALIFSVMSALSQDLLFVCRFSEGYSWLQVIWNLSACLHFFKPHFCT